MEDLKAICASSQTNSSAQAAPASCAGPLPESTAAALVVVSVGNNLALVAVLADVNVRLHSLPCECHDGWLSRDAPVFVLVRQFTKRLLPMIEDTPIKFVKPIRYLSSFHLGATSGLNARPHGFPDDLITSMLLQNYMSRYHAPAKQECVRAMNWCSYA